MTDIIQAIESDYGITKPDIDYTTYDALEYGRDVRAHPYTDGDTPGQVFFPHFRGARLNSDNTCVDFRAVGGGVHSYRPMIAHKYINDNVKAWVDKVKAHPETNIMIRNFAGDIYSMFFKNDGNNNAFGSTIGNAPPIWQDIAAAFFPDPRAWRSGGLRVRRPSGRWHRRAGPASWSSRRGGRSVGRRRLAAGTALRR